MAPAPSRPQATPLFETGDARYDWLNMVQGVALGHLDGDTVVYDVHVIKRPS